MVARMKELGETGRLTIPPPVFVEMGGEFVDMDLDAALLTVRFPVESRFQNPLGYMQGGIIAAAIDNVIGPLSFMVAPPSVTKSLTIDYLRPVNENVEAIYVTARLERRQERELIFVADVRRHDEALFARARSVNILLKQRRN
jgi:uncharacterized protein (TIGR00369 family)